MKTKRLLFLLFIALFTMTITAEVPTRNGWWKFDDSTDMLKATIGNPLSTYGTADNESVPGPVEGNLAIMDPIGHALVMDHGIGANGGGSLTNEYSLQIDFMVPAPIPSYVSFLQTGPMNDADGDLFIKASGVIGLGDLGWSTKTVVADTWYRLIIAAKCGEYYRVYVNGELYLEKLGIAVDSRHALKTLPHIFGDDDGEDPTIHCAELAVWDVALTEEHAIELGDASQPMFPQPKGQWKFDDANNLMTATIGNDLVPEATITHIAAEGPADGNGAIVDGTYQSLVMNHGIDANGGGSLVNIYSLQIDFKAIGTSPGYYSFFQTGAANSGDGDLFIKWAGGTGVIGLGVLGWSTETVAPETWYRMIVTSSGDTYKVYIDGELWLEKTGIAVDSRHALQVAELPHIFADDDGEEGVMHCAELAVWDIELNAEQVAQLGNVNGELTGLRQPMSTYNSLLGQNYPNPFAVNTVFPYTIQESESVMFKVLDLTGKQLNVISAGNKAPGNYFLEVNADKLVNGIYYLQMISNGKTSVRKMVVSK
jgi:hypothetical protein